MSMPWSLNSGTYLPDGLQHELYFAKTSNTSGPTGWNENHTAYTFYRGDYYFVYQWNEGLGSAVQIGTYLTGENDHITGMTRYFQPAAPFFSVELFKNVPSADAIREAYGNLSVALTNCATREVVWTGSEPPESDITTPINPATQTGTMALLGVKLDNGVYSYASVSAGDTPVALNNGAVQKFNLTNFCKAYVTEIRNNYDCAAWWMNIGGLAVIPGTITDAEFMHSLWQATYSNSVNLALLPGSIEGTVTAKHYEYEVPSMTEARLTFVRANVGIPPRARLAPRFPPGMRL